MPSFPTGERSLLCNADPAQTAATHLRTRNLYPAFTEQRIAIAPRRDKGISDHELGLF
jgi:hypothetical protein